MKPTKNRMFCLASKKYKMIFETQAKADNFLKFNHDEILEENGKAPVRSYYCHFCAAWHVTSNPSSMKGELLDLRDEHQLNDIIEMREQEKTKAKNVNDAKNEKSDEEKAKDKELRKASIEWASKVLKKIGLADVSTYTIDFEKAEDLLDISKIDLDEMVEAKCAEDSVNTVQSNITRVSTKLTSYRELYSMSKEDLNALLSMEQPTSEQRKSFGFIKNALIVKDLEEAFLQMEVLMEKGDYHERKVLFNHCKQIIECFHGDGSKILNSRYKKILNEHRLSACKKASQTDIDNPAYKSAILLLIEDLETIEKEYNSQNFEECKELIDIGYKALLSLDVENKDTTLLKAYFERWSNKLNDI